jgi:hypothetical protein
MRIPPDESWMFCGDSSAEMDFCKQIVDTVGLVVVRYIAAAVLPIRFGCRSLHAVDIHN